MSAPEPGSLSGWGNRGSGPDRQSGLGCPAGEGLRRPPLSRRLPPSAGVGRTGVFITLSIVLERMRYEGVVDIFQTVKMLRTQRPAMVQTEVSGRAGGGSRLSQPVVSSVRRACWERVVGNACLGLQVGRLTLDTRVD